MGVFSYLRRFTGLVDVKVEGTVVRVEGVGGYNIQKDISQLYETSRVGNNLFNHVDGSSISFESFFLPEVIYTLDKLINTSNRKRVFNKIKLKLLESTWLSRVNLPVQSKLNYNKLNEFHLTPLDFQQEFFDKYDKLTQQYGLNGFLFAGSAGSGKAQPMTSFVKVPRGWKLMKDIKVGDEVECPDGTTSKVNAIYPQGVKPIFRITFSDKRTAECTADHLWKIIRPKGHNHWFEECVTTNQLMTYMSFNKFRGRIHIPLIEPDQTEDIDLPIDPYILGVLIGDGSFTEAVSMPSITHPDEFILEEVKRLLPEDLEVRVRNTPNKCMTYALASKERGSQNSIIQKLKEIKLYGCKSYDKFIPDEYLVASTNQRLALLQGLMDTDGTIGKYGSCQFTTTSYVVAVNCQYLVRSLGGIAKITLKHPTYTYKGEKFDGRVAYNVNIRFKKPSMLFRLPRKKERAIDDHQYSEHLRLRIDKIEYVRNEEAQCISVDHPEHLYITDNFVVTHNTYSSLALAYCLEADKIVVISPKNAVHRVWEDTLLTKLKTTPEYYISSAKKNFTGKEKVYIYHYEDLQKALNDTKQFNTRNLVIILDESHNLNEIKSQRTNYFIDLCKKTDCKNIILLSGTPIKALSTETIPLFRCIDPLFTPKVEEKFRKIFRKDSGIAVEMINNRMGLVSFLVPKERMKLTEPIIEHINIKTPNAHLYTIKNIQKEMKKFIQDRANYYESRRKSDEEYFYQVLQNYEAGLSSNDRKEYDTYRTYLKRIIKTTNYYSVNDEMVFCNKYELNKIMPTLSNEDKHKFKEVKSIVKYIELKIKGECLGKIVGGMRQKCFTEVASEIDYEFIINKTTKKTLVFTSYVESLLEAERKCKAQNLLPVVVYGKTNAALNKIIKEFESNDQLDPIIATFDSLSTAVPMVMCDVVVMINVPFRDYELQQAISRVHRLGSDTQVYVYMYYLDTGSEGNISTRSKDILAWSQNEIEKILGISSPYTVDSDSNVALESYIKILDGDAISSNKSIPAFIKW